MNPIEALCERLIFPFSAQVLSGGSGVARAMLSGYFADMNYGCSPLVHDEGLFARQVFIGSFFAPPPCRAAFASA